MDGGAITLDKPLAMKMLSWLGRLPRWMLTLLAWKVTFLALLVGGYRGKVVRANLKRAFPDLSRGQRWWRYAGFQRHFAQLMVELSLIHI